MARRGANWYKREPHAYLGGVRGMTAKQHAAYGVILDLIYDYGGVCPNDPRWISGWISDMGAAAVRRAISDLIDLGKLALEDGCLTNRRATIEAKTDKELRENRQITGEIGGKKSAETRARALKNNSLAQPNGSTHVQPEKIREERTPYSPPLGDERKGTGSQQITSPQAQFSEFWEAYPRKTAKVAAEAKFLRLVKSGKVTAIDLITGAERYAAEVAGRAPAQDGRIPICHPTTWLNQGRWEDEIEVPNSEDVTAGMTPEERERFARLVQERKRGAA